MRRFVPSLISKETMKLSCQEHLVPGETFAQKLKNLEKYGFDGVEIHGEYANTAAQLAERKAALADSLIKASSLCGGHPTNLVHPDSTLRQITRDALKRHLDAAAELGAAGPITVPIFNEQERVPDLSPWKGRAQIERELLLAMLGEIIPHAQSVGAAILLEPLNRYESNSLPQQEDGASIVRELNSPGLRLMSDTFHMNIEERSIPATIRAVGDCIGHVHLADSTRLEPGTGSLDFGAIFAALREVGFEGYMALECGLSEAADQALPRCAAFLRERIPD